MTSRYSYATGVKDVCMVTGVLEFITTKWDNKFSRQSECQRKKRFYVMRIQNHHWPVCIFLLTTLTSCQKKGTSLLNDQTGEGEILVAKSNDSTHNSVVAILRIDTADNVVVSASGVLIHPQVILTAGHVNFKNSATSAGGCKPKGFVSISNHALTETDRI